MSNGPVLVACGVFLLCDKAAEGVAVTRSVGHVPACARCATRQGFPFTAGYFVQTDDREVVEFREGAANVDRTAR